MRSTSVKSFAITLTLLFALSTTAAPARQRGQEPRDKQETVIVRLQKIAKRFVHKFTTQDTEATITLPKP
jgi:hypothetical protein